LRKLVKFTVNGKPFQVLVSPNKTLLDVLRTDMGLTGAKYACGTGECGACTVIVDGKPILACLTLAITLNGKNILTVEGLTNNGELHPIQESFIEQGAIQCGFCTPGFVMITKSLLDENLDLTEEKIRDYVRGNLCRCTGYAKIVEGVLSVTEKKKSCMKNDSASTHSNHEEPVYTVVGKRLPRVDAKEKVTGEAKFTHDIELPGMLWCKILRSPYPHAKIKKIDVSKAKELPGVEAVITAEDMPKTKIGHDPELLDKSPLADDKVRYVGDEVAAVAAIDEETAEKALSLIQVDYEQLPAVFDPEEAMKPNAPKIHDYVENNILKSYHWMFGDVEKGFKEADYIFEDKFTTQQQPHICMETHSCVANWDSEGKLTFWSSTQVPHVLRSRLAEALDIPYTKVNIKSKYTGGGFGGKTELFSHDVICAFLAKKTGKPVKLILSREEEFTCTGTRHPAIIKIKTGVKKDGTITTRYVKAILDKGAYASQYTVLASIGWKAAHYYRIANYKFDGYAVYTNKPFGTAMRAFGGPQICFAIESQMDMIAEKLGMDPLDLRLKNANKPGDITVIGSKLASCGLSECLRSAAKTIGWKKKRNEMKKRNHQVCMHRGVGIASAFHECGFRGHIGKVDLSSATVKINKDGTVQVFAGGSEIGVGYNTVLTQIAAEELGVCFEDVKIVTGDTNLTPVDLGLWASRGTFFSGNAVKMAVADAKRQLLEAAAEILNTTSDELEVRDGKIYVKNSPEKEVHISDVARHSYLSKGEPIIGRSVYESDATLPDEKGKYTPPGACPTYSFAACVAEVEIDAETGQVHVLQIVSAHDCGFAINPINVEGQIEGGIAQGLGHTFLEGLIYKEGKALNAAFLDHKIFTAKDMPKIKPLIIETIDPKGPFGAKGTAEVGTSAVPAAIANAIYNAIGIRFRDLPITPEDVLKSLKKK